MSTELKNDTLEVANDKIELFFEMIKGHDVVLGETLGDAIVFEGVSKYPQRLKCATAAWQALQEVIANG
jgi:nitrogen fixation NifU-like protein